VFRRTRHFFNLKFTQRMTYTTEARLDHLGFDHGVLEPKRRGVASWFFWVLVVSISVNVAVIAFLAFQMQDGVLWFEVETQEPVVTTLPDASRSESLKGDLLQLFSKSDEELIGALDDEKVVANGYRLQELALALLRARGYQVEDPLRPLGAWPQPMSAFSWSDSEGKTFFLKLFSNVGLREIQAVKAFLRDTAVPLTAEGIVRKMKEGDDSALMKASLFRTDEWTSFSRVFSALTEAEILLLSNDIGGEAFSSIVDWGHSHSDPKEIGSFVVTVFSKYPSPFLAELVASSYADVVVLQALDDTVLLLYSFLPSQSEAGVRLAMRLLHGQRRLPVWQASQAYLARAASMPSLSSMNRDQVLEWFQHMAYPAKTAVASQPVLQTEGIAVKKPEASTVLKPQLQKPETSTAIKPQPQKSVPVKPSTPASQVSTRVATRQLQPYRVYVVRKGDTLWSVARRCNVDVEKLKYLNGLKGTTLSPGKVLRIPH
jgi:LysM repeat protein